MMTAGKGYRGYIGSRPYFGRSVPQQVQNLTVRDYCNRNGLPFLLSITEYAMEGCYMMLADAADNASQIGGIVLYSLSMLPRDSRYRSELCNRFIKAGATIHGAVENTRIASDSDLATTETIWQINDLAASAKNTLNTLHNNLRQAR